MHKGLLISFEGLDGSGKTTQIDALGSWLFDRGISYLATREPGGTQIGEKIRHLIMHPGEELDPLAEAFLFQADRAQHFATKVLPALDEGKIVLCDRCFDSSIVYQGFVKNVGIAYVEQLSIVAMRGRIPDLTILLDISPQEVYKRRMVGLNRFDNESLRFHEDIRHGFLSQAKVHSGRIKIIDASKDVKEVYRQVVKLVEALLKDRDEDGVPECDHSRSV